jgi:acyl carrier protein
MKTKKTQELAQELVSRTLNVNPNNLIPSTKIHDFPEWDSLGHLQIIQTLEKKFEITIEDEGLFERLTRFDKIIDFVRIQRNKKGEN